MRSLQVIGTIIVMIGLLLTAGCSLSNGGLGESVEATHRRWVDALVAGDPNEVDRLSADMDYHDVFVYQTLTRMEGFVQRGAGERGGAFKTAEDRGVRPAGGERYGFSTWIFASGTICYRATLTPQKAGWRVRAWNEVKPAECGG